MIVDDDQDAIYRTIDVLVRPILESNAKRFAGQLNMTFAEALQEARFGLMLALRKYDYNDSKGGIFNYVKLSVRRHFLKVWAVQRTQRRRPHMQVVAEGGKRVSLPVPFLDPEKDLRGRRRYAFAGDSSPTDFMDTIESPSVCAPDAPLVTAEAESMANAFQEALEKSLSDRDRQVLSCKTDPPRALRMMMLDELADEPTIPLIGKYLGLSKNEVDWALRRIRDTALSLIKGDFSDLADLAIVRPMLKGSRD